MQRVQNFLLSYVPQKFDIIFSWIPQQDGGSAESRPACDKLPVWGCNGPKSSFPFRLSPRYNTTWHCNINEIYFLIFSSGLRWNQIGTGIPHVAWQHEPKMWKKKLYVYTYISKHEQTLLWCNLIFSAFRTSREKLAYLQTTSISRKEAIQSTTLLHDKLIVSLPWVSRSSWIICK